MKFHDREYFTHVFFVDHDAPRPWVHSAWTEVSKATDPIFASARDRPAVRSIQFQGLAPHMREISFGRISHNSKGAAKWTHLNDGQLISGDPATFLGTEIWAPSWNACVRDRRAPDAYISLGNRYGFTAKALQGNLHYPAVCVFAFASDLGEAVTREGRMSAALLAEAVQSSLGFSMIRPWGRSTFGDGFTDAINDLSNSEPVRSRIREADDPASAMIGQNWTPFRSKLT
jgi:hypothetical protein